MSKCALYYCPENKRIMKNLQTRSSIKCQLFGFNKKKKTVHYIYYTHVYAFIHYIRTDNGMLYQQNENILSIKVFILFMFCVIPKSV